MNQVDLIKYMKANNLIARVGNPETLESAKALEDRGIVKHIGDDDEGKPIYRITKAGQAKLGMGSEPTTEGIKTGALKLPKGIE